MLKAKLQYNDFLGDGKRFYKILCEHNVQILKTTREYAKPKVTIRIKDNEELNKLLLDLSTNCVNAIKVLKVKNEKIRGK